MRKKPTYNRGSLLPSIVQIEQELIAREEEAQEIARECVQEAKRASEKLIEDTRKELPHIEEEERRRLFEEDSKEERELITSEEQAYGELELSIKRNHEKALEFILKGVLPRWDGVLPLERQKRRDR